MTLYQEFNNAGLAVIPLKDGRPTVKWSAFFERLPTKEEASGFRGREYGLVCGKPSGVIGIDIDTDDTDEIYMLAGESPVHKRGTKGFTAFYSYNGESSHLWKHNGEVICELLSDKRLTTIPPSPHRKTGEPYVWLEEGLIDARLPVLSEDFIVEMDKLFPRPAPKIRTEHYVDEDIDLGQAEEMIAYINPSLPRDEWITIGMALRDEFGDAACNLWHEWSSKSNKYNLRDAQSVWRSFCHDGVTIGTLIHYAKQGGWEKEYQYQESEFSVDISYIFEKKSKPLKVHGLVGEIAEWITETAMYPQPILSLGAALTFIGLVKGRRICGRTDLRTNMLCMNLAPSGGGKNHPQHCINKLVKSCGLDRHMMGEPTSGTAMLTGLENKGLISLLMIDEIGRWLGNLSLKNVSGHQREILDNMVKLFSCANGTFYGRQYANEKENPQKVLEQAHFCCLGSTVIEKFQQSVTSSEIIDGFLNRWLLFYADSLPDEQSVKRSVPPQALVDRIMAYIDANPRPTDAYGNPEPTEMSMTPEAMDLFMAFKQKSKELKLDTPYPLNQLYARSAEHVEKVAMCLADDLFVGTNDINLAIQIVEQSNETIKHFANGIADNQHEADLNYVFDIIKRNPNISRNKLTQKTRRIENRKRTDIINQLIEGDEIIATKQGKKLTFITRS